MVLRCRLRSSTSVKPARVRSSRPRASSTFAIPSMGTERSVTRPDPSGRAAASASRACRCASKDSPCRSWARASQACASVSSSGPTALASACCAAGSAVSTRRAPTAVAARRSIGSTAADPEIGGPHSNATLAASDRDSSGRGTAGTGCGRSIVAVMGVGPFRHRRPRGGERWPARPSWPRSRGRASRSLRRRTAPVGAAGDRVAA